MPSLSVVICSLNGAGRIGRCLRALSEQTIRSAVEIIVVDDGSDDDTSGIARSHGATVIRHATNRGVSAGRNSGMRAASALVVAFLDDDCEPDPLWAEQILGGYGEGVLGVGGTIAPSTGTGFLYGYLRRHNRHAPLGLELTESESIPYRLFLYLKRQWATAEPSGQRNVYAFAGANMSFRRSSFLEIGGFDELFRFGAEEEDLCRRLRRAYPGGRLIFMPEAVVLHHFEASFRGTLRRNYAYGRGSIRFYRKWPSLRPKFFPAPVIVLGLLVLSIRWPLLAAVAFVVPHTFFPSGLRAAIVDRHPSYVLDAYMQLAQELFEDVGIIDGLWRFRHLSSESIPRADSDTKGASGSISPDSTPALSPMNQPNRND